MKRVIKNLDVLKVLAKSDKKLRCAIIKNSNCDLINTLVECILNVLNGNIKLDSNQKKQLNKFKFQLRKSIQNINLKDKKRIFIQHGGFLQFLLPAIITGLSSIIGSYISK